MGLKKPKEIIQKVYNETAQVYDESQHEWEKAYIAKFKRVKVHTFLKAITFDATTTTKTSEIFECIAYKKALLLLSIDVTGAPTDIVFRVQFSDDGINFYNYVRGPFGDLRYEDAAGDKTECIDLPILATYMRMVATATGTEATKTFLVTVKASFAG